MNRTLIIGAIVIALGGTGYYQFVYKPQQEAAMLAEAQKKAEEAATAAAAEAAAAEAATAAGTTEVVTDAAAALDPANFNAAAVTALIDGSALDDATKATLKTAVDAAAANPALVADTVAQVKTALGM